MKSCPAAVSWVSVFSVEDQPYHAHQTGVRRSTRVSCSTYTLELTTVCIKSDLQLWYQIHGIDAIQMRIAQCRKKLRWLNSSKSVLWTSLHCVYHCMRTHLDFWICKRRPTACASRGSMHAFNPIAQMNWFPNPAIHQRLLLITNWFVNYSDYYRNCLLVFIILFCNQSIQCVPKHSGIRKWDACNSSSSVQKPSPVAA